MVISVCNQSYWCISCVPGSFSRNPPLAGIAVLPLVIDEQQMFPFKFWFGDQIQTGMHFQNELFCQLGTVDIQQRSQLYQHACKITQQGIPLVITCTKTHCHLWGSLRDETIKRILLAPPGAPLQSLLRAPAADWRSSSTASSNSNPPAP